MCVNCNTTNCTGCNNLTIPVGPAGRGITNITEIAGVITIYYSDGTTSIHGPIEGIPGPAGADGNDGAIGPAGANGAAGADGQDGASTGIASSSGIAYNEAAPAVIFDIGWGNITVDPATAMLRTTYEDLNVFSGTLQFQGTYAGSGSADILIEFAGPLMISSQENNFTAIAFSSGSAYPVRIWPDPQGATNYLRIEFGASDLPLTSLTYIIKISGLTLY